MKSSEASEIEIGFPLPEGLHGEHSPAAQYLLGEDEWDEVPHVHGFRRGAPARVEIEWLLVFIGIHL